MTPKLIFSDFDGTLTDKHGFISQRFFDVTGHLDKMQLPMIIVSGRSVSWGHFFLTHTPMDFAIMEGGGLILKSNGHDIEEELMVSEDDVLKLIEFSQKTILSEWGKYLSADSFGRKTDRAFEFYAMSNDDKKRLVEFVESEGLNYSASNVHLNVWSGEVSKFKAVEFYLKKYRPDLTSNDCLYFGDALNDESMFKHFPVSIGVSNIQKYLSMMTFPPSIVLKGEENSYIEGVYNYLSENVK